jgi:hypothetical protein
VRRPSGLPGILRGAMGVLGLAGFLLGGIFGGCGLAYILQRTRSR